MQNRDDLQAHIEQRFASMTGEEVLRLLDDASIANAHLNSVEAFLGAFMPHMAVLTGDIPNYTDVEAVIQFNEIKITRSY